MGFRALRVVNEDRVQPGQGFGTHPHRDMEIVTYVLEGGWPTATALGHGSTIHPGDVQRIERRHGVTHSEFNASRTGAGPLPPDLDPPRPDRPGAELRAAALPGGERRGRLRLVASPDGADGSVTVHQDACLLAALLAPGQAVGHALASGAPRLVQVARGAVEVSGQRLSAGDGAALSRETEVALRGIADSRCCSSTSPEPCRRATIVAGDRGTRPPAPVRRPGSPPGGPHAPSSLRLFEGGWAYGTAQVPFATALERIRAIGRSSRGARVGLPQRPARPLRSRPTERRGGPGLGQLPRLVLHRRDRPPGPATRFAM